jgi:dCTP diphosphatase
MNDNDTTIKEMRKRLKAFIDERDWDQFHKPKDIGLALIIEAAEILEHFRFKTDKEIEEFLNDSKNKEELGDELGDTLMFIIDLARVCNIDLAEAFERKLGKSAKKYPVDLVKGKSHKYTYYNKESCKDGEQ